MRSGARDSTYLDWVRLEIELLNDCRRQEIQPILPAQYDLQLEFTGAISSADAFQVL
jgi:hypothetical protein